MKIFISKIIQNIQSFFRAILTRFLNAYHMLVVSISTFRDYIKSDKKRLVMFFLSFPLVAAIGTTGYLIFRKHYTIHPSIRSSFSMIPADAEFYFEIKNTTIVKEKLQSSDTFKRIQKSEEWSQFFSTLTESKFGELSYLVQLKTNSILDWTDFLGLFSESIGYAAFTDGSYLVIGKTNLKSLVAVKILSSFGAKPIDLEYVTENQPKPLEVQNQESNENIVSGDSYESSFLTREIQSGNLIISQINGNQGLVYIVMVDGYLFLSDSLNTLTKSLEAATNPSKTSLIANKEMGNISENYYKGGVFGILYLNLVDTKLTPFLKPLFENANSVSFLFKTESNLLTADILTTERQTIPLSSSIKIDALERSIPKDSLLAIYSNSLGLKEYIHFLENPGTSWPDLKLRAPDYFKNGKLSPEKYFISNSPSVLLLHQPIYDDKTQLLYPNFSITYSSRTEDDLFMNTIFRPGKAKTTTFISTNIKTITHEETFYTPSIYRDTKLSWLSSTEEHALSLISVKNGNKPALSDLKSLKILSPWKEAPHHIVLNWQRFNEDFQTFLNYGGVKSKSYSEKTVKTDIYPLLQSFQWIESIHIALGAIGNTYGKLIIAPL